MDWRRVLYVLCCRWSIGIYFLTQWHMCFRYNFVILFIGKKFSLLQWIFSDECTLSSLKILNYLLQQSVIILVKINIYNQQFLFWLILIFFFPWAGPGRDLPLARGQAGPVRPVLEEWTMSLLLTLAWLRSSVNIALFINYTLYYLLFFRSFVC